MATLKVTLRQPPDAEPTRVPMKAAAGAQDDAVTIFFGNKKQFSTITMSRRQAAVLIAELAEALA